MIKGVTMPSPTLRHVRSPSMKPTSLGRAVLIACVVIAAASLATVVVALPGGAPTSRDPGAPVVPWWVVLLPAVVGIALATVLPPRAPAQPAVVENRSRSQLQLFIERATEQRDKLQRQLDMADEFVDLLRKR